MIGFSLLISVLLAFVCCFNIQSWTLSLCHFQPWRYKSEQWLSGTYRAMSGHDDVRALLCRFAIQLLKFIWWIIYIHIYIYQPTFFFDGLMPKCCGSWILVDPRVPVSTRLVITPLGQHGFWGGGDPECNLQLGTIRVKYYSIWPAFLTDGLSRKPMCLPWCLCPPSPGCLNELKSETVK